MELELSSSLSARLYWFVANLLTLLVNCIRLGMLLMNI